MSNPPFTVKAVFDYASDHTDDLTFSIGQIIRVTDEEDADWYYGEYTDDSGSKKEGLFPKNFVEKYDPPAPPRPTRPTRTRREPEVVAAPEPAETPAVETRAAPEPISEAEPEPTREKEIAPQRALSPPPSATVPAPVIPSSPPRQAAAPAPPPLAAEPVQNSASKPPPPAKPTGSSFRDRIAAFNKPAAPPIAPFKPGGLSSQTFIRKPFVAPPPSKNAFVPQPREPPPKIYRREEDPEIVNREPPVSESRPVSNDTSEGAEEQPKPTSLKERIALLQKQQLEQAARHAEAAAKKEKPKKPPKKRAPSQDQPPAEGVEMERTDTDETAKDPAIEAVRTQQPSRELMSDTNDADYSAAADTEDADETSTSKEDAEDHPSRQPKQSKEEGQEEEEGGEEDEEDEEEEEIDPEIKRRMELRERMAKMSGGMGMMGMFGPPGGLPGMPIAGARKPKPPAPERKQSADSGRTEPAAHAPPVPVMALPGMNVRKAPEPTPQVEKEEEQIQAALITEQHPTDEVSDIEDVASEGPSPRVSSDRAAPPPPQGKRWLSDFFRAPYFDANYEPRTSSSGTSSLGDTPCATLSAFGATSLSASGARMCV